jgi:putative transposase
VLGDDTIKSELKRIFNSIAKWKNMEILELNIQVDHIHMLLLADPRHSVSYIMQIIKGKSSAWLKKKIRNRVNLYDKGSLWARGYFVSTVGIDEFIIKRYVRHQHKHNQLEQPTLFPLPRS